MIKVLVCDDDKMITDKVKHLLNDIQEQYSAICFLSRI